MFGARIVTANIIGSNNKIGGRACISTGRAPFSAAFDVDSAGVRIDGPELR